MNAQLSYITSKSNNTEREIDLPGPLYTLPLAMQEHQQAHMPCATSQACAQPLHQVLEKEYLVFVPQGQQSSLQQLPELVR